MTYAAFNCESLAIERRQYLAYRCPLQAFSFCDNAGLMSIPRASPRKLRTATGHAAEYDVTTVYREEHCDFPAICGVILFKTVDRLLYRQSMIAKFKSLSEAHISELRSPVDATIVLEQGADEGRALGETKASEATSRSLLANDFCRLHRSQRCPEPAETGAHDRFSKMLVLF
ncbi:hypothetical protein BCR43DRAFT_507417 [Syncephalastrum racemosum]|uniref:Uncharacterized protein n=1 Tax=Syncephalastrum racemosum TaxID=13706 RepID=A0A1X2H6X2_SYNRA|nr:hypothetical protein BCR43DRAFT_507417 [Syncephalastrum racemosum]